MKNIIILFILFLFKLKAQSQCSYIYFKEVSYQLDEYKAGQEKTNKLVLKLDDSINKIFEPMKIALRSTHVLIDEDSLKKFNSTINNIVIQARTELDIEQKKLDSLILIHIKEKFKSFQDDYSLNRVVISFDEQSNDNCINYSNLFLKNIEAD